MRLNPTSEPSAPARLSVLLKSRQIVLILVGMILFMSVAALIVRQFNKPAASADAVVRERLKKLEANRTAATEAVQTYAWQDKAAGTVRLPVDRAMELTVNDLKNKPVKRSDVPPVPATTGN